MRPAKSRIIRPLFNVKSQNCTWTSKLTYSTATPDMTSPAISVRCLSKFDKLPKMTHPTVWGQILVARRFASPSQLMGFLLPYAMIYFRRHVFVVVHHKVSGSYISRRVWRRITKFASSPLQNAIKYCPKVRKTGPVGKKRWKTSRDRLEIETTSINWGLNVFLSAALCIVARRCKI